MAVLGSSPTLRLGAPARLFALDDYFGSPSRSSYDLGVDGRFLMIRQLEGSGEEAPHEVVLVRNWAVELARRIAR